mgnify:FL=1
MYKKIINIFLAMSILLVFAALPASAHIGKGFSDNFESFQNAAVSWGEAELGYNGWKVKYTRNATASSELMAKVTPTATTKGMSMRFEQNYTQHSSELMSVKKSLAQKFESGSVEIGLSVYLHDLNTRRMLQIMQGGTARTFFYIEQANGRFFTPEAATNIYLSENKWYDIKIVFGLGTTKYDISVVDENGNIQSATLANCYCYKEISDDIIINTRELKGSTNTLFADGVKSVTDVDDIYIKGINRTYDYTFTDNFDNFTDEDLTSYGYYVAYANGTDAKNIGSFSSAETDRGRSVKATVLSHSANCGDAPLFAHNTGNEHRLTGSVYVGFSVYLKDYSIPVRMMFGGLEMFKIASGDGRIYIAGAEKTDCKLQSGKWYDVRIMYNTASKDAAFEIYSGGEYVTSYSLNDSREKNTIEFIQYVYFGTAPYFEYSSSEPGEYFIDNIKISQSEEVYTKNEESGGAFKIAYSTPFTGTITAINSPIRVTFTNKIDISSFNSSTVFVNGEAVPEDSVNFGEDGYTCILNIQREYGESYQVDFKNVKDVNASEYSGFLEFDTYGKEVSSESFSLRNSEGIEPLVLKSGAYTASANISASGEEKRNVRLTVAFYENDNRLIDVKTVTKSVNGGESDKISVSIDVPAYVDESDENIGYSLNAILWEAENIKPIAVCKKIKKEKKPPVIIIKLDDLNAERVNIFEEWADYADSVGVKFGFGVIVNAFDNGTAEQINRIKTLGERENIELWLHGYDHALVNNNGEFRQSREAQKETFEKCIAAADKAGITFKSINAPFNDMNSDTADLLENDFTDITTVMIMTENKPVFLNNRSFNTLYNKNILESGAGTVNTRDVFKDLYDELKNNNYILMQGHPAQWDEENKQTFKDIVYYLKAIGAVFMTPSEYTDSIKQTR